MVQMNKKAQSFWGIIIFLIILAIIIGIIYFIKTDKVLSQGSIVGKIESLDIGTGFFNSWRLLYLEGDNDNVYCYKTGSNFETAINYSKITGIPINMTYSRFLLRGTTCRSSLRKSSYIITSAYAIDQEDKK